MGYYATPLLSMLFRLSFLLLFAAAVIAQTQTQTQNQTLFCGRNIGYCTSGESYIFFFKKKKTFNDSHTHILPCPHNTTTKRKQAPVARPLASAVWASPTAISPIVTRRTGLVVPCPRIFKLAVYYSTPNLALSLSSSRPADPPIAGTNDTNGIISGWINGLPSDANSHPYGYGNVNTNPSAAANPYAYSGVTRRRAGWVGVVCVMVVLVWVMR